MNLAAEPDQAVASQSAAASDLHFVANLLGDPAPVPPRMRQQREAKKRRLKYIERNEASPSDDSKTLLARCKRPTRKNGSKQYFCEACSCSVPARDNDWQTHVSGTKHQRQLVSLLHTGQFGNNVVSLFEADPGILGYA